MAAFCYDNYNSCNYCGSSFDATNNLMARVVMACAFVISLAVIVSLALVSEIIVVRVIKLVVIIVSIIITKRIRETREYTAIP